MSISLKAMRYYCTALQHGSIAKAASELNVAASAVGAAIDQIEDHFQLTLTVRQRARGILATADGTRMAERFTTLLEDYDSILRDGAAQSQRLTGDLRIGYYAPVAPAFLPDILTGLMAPAHNITLHLEACNNTQAQDGLRRGDYDAILFVPETDERWIKHKPLVSAPPFCLMAADHPLAAQDTVSLSDLADQQLVSLHRPYVSEYYHSLFANAGQSPRLLARCNSTEMVRSLVGASKACAILNMLPLTALSYAGDTLAARPIRDPLPSLTLSVGYRAGPQRRTVSEFVHRCELYFAEPHNLICRGDDAPV